MIITRTITPGTIRISSLVYEIALAFLSSGKFNELIEYREDSNIDNFLIDVDATWNATDDATLDGVIAAHLPGPKAAFVDQEKYRSYPIITPFSTNSTTFQLAFSQSFVALPTWVLEMTFFIQINIANASQSGDFELRLNGNPFITNNIINMASNNNFPFSGSGPLENLLLGNNTLDIYIRKVSGNALITLQGGLLTTKLVDTL